MIATAALANLASRLSEIVQRPVVLGENAQAEQPFLQVTVHSLTPVPDVTRSSGRHIADQQTALSWNMQLILRGQSDHLLAGLQLIEAAAADIEARPVIGVDNWRADMALEVDADWAKGIGPAIGIRMRVAFT